MQQVAVRSERTAAKAPPRRKRLFPSWTSRLVLLVEDDDEMRRLLARALRSDGLRVVEAADGDDALDWLGPWALDGNLEAAPDLIVSDIRLPYFSGLEILEGIHIAADPIPVILITGFPDDETVARARSLGASCVLAKPFDLEDFRRAVWRALEPT